MPDAITSFFQTTLVVLYFVTPAETVDLAPGKKPDFEKTKIWTLQSTSQIPTENPNMCVANGLLLIKEFEQVSTVTVRAYCLCPEHVTGPDDFCEEARKNLVRRGVKPPPATVIRIGPDTKMPVRKTP
jgi:hypothetical protein